KTLQEQSFHRSRQHHIALSFVDRSIHHQVEKVLCYRSAQCSKSNRANLGFGRFWVLCFGIETLSDPFDVAIGQSSDKIGCLDKKGSTPNGQAPLVSELVIYFN